MSEYTWKTAPKRMRRALWRERVDLVFEVIDILFTLFFMGGFLVALFNHDLFHLCAFGFLLLWSKLLDLKKEGDW